MSFIRGNMTAILQSMHSNCLSHEMETKPYFQYIGINFQYLSYLY